MRITLFHQMTFAVVFIACLCPVTGQTLTEVRKDGQVEIDCGTAVGVRPGMTAWVVIVKESGGKPVPVRVARLVVDAASESRCRGRIVECSQGLELTVGMSVQFEEKLSAASHPTNTPEPSSRPLVKPLKLKPLEKINLAKSRVEEGKYTEALELYRELDKELPDRVLYEEDYNRAVQLLAASGASDTGEGSRARRLAEMLTGFQDALDKGNCAEAEEIMRRMKAELPATDSQIAEWEQQLEASRKKAKTDSAASDDARLAELRKQFTEAQEAGAWDKALQAAADADRIHPGDPEIQEWKQKVQEERELTVLLDGSIIRFVRIPPGEFIMGSDGGRKGERPAHRVRISRPIQMSRHEITEAQWRSVLGDAWLDQGGRKVPWWWKEVQLSNSAEVPSAGGPNYPVHGMTFREIKRFIRELNFRNDGFRYRLPTEAEWEYVCLAGRTSLNEVPLSDVAWYRENSGEVPHPVGQLAPNPWGLYDMLGNVAEWVNDYAKDHYYQESPSSDPPGPQNDWLDQRIVRGGHYSSLADDCRSYRRFKVYEAMGMWGVGFRLVREPK